MANLKREALDYHKLGGKPGKVAIVYSHPEEAVEMRRHVDFLRLEGFLTGETEFLDLDRLQGVHGLRALRATINLESDILAQKVSNLAEQNPIESY